MALNPMTGIVQGFRSAFFGRPVDWGTLGLSAVITLLILILATFTFSRVERSFADVI
jgi:lipopolysaccharide transport system permease protein